MYQKPDPTYDLPAPRTLIAWNLIGIAGAVGLAGYDLLHYRPERWLTALAAVVSLSPMMSVLWKKWKRKAKESKQNARPSAD